MSVDWEIRWSLDMIPAQLEAITPIALARAADGVMAVAVSRTPNVTEHLAGSAGVTVTGAGVNAVAEIKYPGPYAAYQNRGMRADGTHIIRDRRNGKGQTGFLTETMKDQVELATAIMRDTIFQHLG